MAEASINLLKYFIYNSKCAIEDGKEHEKLVYYYPPENSLEKKVRDIGFCEGVIRFNRNFNVLEHVEVIRTRKTRQYLHEVEDGFCIVMVISVPFQKTNENEEIEYFYDDVQDNILKIFLAQTYQTFSFFHGSYTSILHSPLGNLEKLKHEIQIFFSWYLPLIRPNNVNVADIQQGLHFLPLSRENFLKVYCFVNHLEIKFSNVKYTCVLLNDLLIWSGLKPEDMQTLYQYLIIQLFPKALDMELNNSTSIFSLSHSILSNYYGRFLTGSSDIFDSNFFKSMPSVFINHSEQQESYKLLVYKSQKAAVCMLLENSFQVDLVKELDVFLRSELFNLEKDIDLEYQKLSLNSVEPLHKFIYFNSFNLAQKTTIHSDFKRSGKLIINKNTVKILSDLHSDIRSCNIIVKTLQDQWLAAKLSGEREYYLILNCKSGNLLDAIGKVMITAVDKNDLRSPEIVDKLNAFIKIFNLNLH